MLQYNFITGATLNVADLLVSGYNGQELPMDEIRILVDTSSPRTVILPASSTLPIHNIKITVVDATGNAGSNPITVLPAAGDTIEGQSSVSVSNAYQPLRFEIMDSGIWSAVNFNAGGGGGSGIIIQGSGGLSSMRCAASNIAASCGGTVFGINNQDGGGCFNTISGGYCNIVGITAGGTASGGAQNSVSGYGGTVAGGFCNTASGNGSVVGS